jgi:hypothetical protein
MLFAFKAKINVIMSIDSVLISGKSLGCYCCIFFIELYTTQWGMVRYSTVLTENVPHIVECMLVSSRHHAGATGPSSICWAKCTSLKLRASQSMANEVMKLIFDFDFLKFQIKS